MVRCVNKILLYTKTSSYNTKQNPGSRHRLFLSWIPLFNSTPSLIHQRKVILHGARVRDAPEDATEREIRREIRSVMPDLFEGYPQSVWTSRTALLEKCTTLMTATRYEQVRTFRQWLLPVFKTAVAGYVFLDKFLFFPADIWSYIKDYNKS